MIGGQRYFRNALRSVALRQGLVIVSWNSIVTEGERHAENPKARADFSRAQFNLSTSLFSRAHKGQNRAESHVQKHENYGLYGDNYLALKLVLESNH